MERDGEVDAQFLAAPFHDRHDAGGREGQLAARNGDAVAVGQNTGGAGDVVVVVERLAHAHQDDVGDLPVEPGRGPVAQRIPRQHQLPDDLAGVQVAHPGLGAGVAEAAVERAADLGGEAQRAPVLLRNEHHLRFAGVREAQQPFARAVGRDLRLSRDRPIQRVAFGQLHPCSLRDAGHLLERPGAAVIDPVPELPGPERRLAEGAHRLAEAGHVGADEGRAARSVSGREWRRGIVLSVGRDAVHGPGSSGPAALRQGGAIKDCRAPLPRGNPLRNGYEPQMTSFPRFRGCLCKTPSRRKSYPSPASAGEVPERSGGDGGVSARWRSLLGATCVLRHATPTWPPPLKRGRYSAADAPAFRRGIRFSWGGPGAKRRGWGVSDRLRNRLGATCVARHATPT